MVVKLGGSLMGSSELSSWLDAIETKSRQSNIIIVPGGGRFADTIRDFQKTYQFADNAAHKMAIMAMCQYGYLLNDLNNNLKIINDHKQITDCLDSKQPLLWLPIQLIEDDSELDSGWDVTSDSIALWLASKINANQLILVKSKALSNDIAHLRKHIENNDLDRAFERYSTKYLGEITFLSKYQYSEF